MYVVTPTEKFVPSAIGIPPGLNTIADGVSLLAAVAPPRPVTRASCSLMLNAFADAIAEEPSVAAKRILDRLLLFMVTSTCSPRATSRRRVACGRCLLVP